jgi:hypothetical protein
MADATTGSNLTPGQGIGTDIAGIISLIQSLGGKDASNASQVAHIADPFMDQRPQYQQQMQQFMSDPSAIFNDPAFKAAQSVGGEAVARNAGAAGMGNSGNKLASLFSFGQSSALDFEKMKYNELLPLTGATTGNPGAAAFATQMGQQNQQKGISAGLAGIGGIIDALVKAGLPAGLAKQIGEMFGGGSGVTSGDITGYGLTDPGTASGGLGGALTDTNAVTGDMSSGDVNIINDIFGGTDQIPDIGSLFGG